MSILLPFFVPFSLFVVILVIHMRILVLLPHWGSNCAEGRHSSHGSAPDSRADGRLHCYRGAGTHGSGQQAVPGTLPRQCPQKVRAGCTPGGQSPMVWREWGGPYEGVKGCLKDKKNVESHQESVEGTGKFESGIPRDTE